MSGNNIHVSILKTTSVEYSEKVAKERGWKIAPKDHLIYSEGSTIIFLNHHPQQLQASLAPQPSPISKL
jgi:hypothetical protein